MAPDPKAVGTASISFSDMATAWGAAGYNGGSNPAPDGTNISLSEFRGAQFTNSTSIPSIGSISIDTNFKGKTFKSAGGGKGGKGGK
tara:strand:+ start:1005 stop:1265 length:261 start_codon:yes stop_codon:yes gene_type:complete